MPSETSSDCGSSLRRQRRQISPLKVIAEALDAFDRGLAGGHRTMLRKRPRKAADPALAAMTDGASGADTAVRLTRPELKRATGLEARAWPISSRRLIHADDAACIPRSIFRSHSQRARSLSHGVEVRHLRPFRLAAEREVALVRGLGGMSPEVDPDELVRQCLELHLALVRAGPRVGVAWGS